MTTWLHPWRMSVLAVCLAAAAPAGAALIESSAPQTPAPHWAVEGNKAQAWLGFSAAAAGDVNGDGFGDLLAGAYGFDGGEPGEGKAFLYYGSPGGLSPIVGWSTEGQQAQAYLGISVACAGDVNGDGFADVALGAYGYDGAKVNGGRVLVFLGSAAGLASEPAWTADGDLADAYLGRSVAGAGDVNGDGFGDLLAGAHAHSGPGANAGRAYLFLGSAEGLGTQPAWTADGQQAGGHFGLAVAPVGDVNGDGFADAAVGAPLQDMTAADEGCAYVFLGSAGGLAAAPAWTGRGGQANAQFGSAVGLAGDFNADGWADLAVGAPGYTGTAAAEGQVSVFFGGPGGVSNAAGWAVPGGLANAQFGRSVGSAGDVNGDAIGDLLVGAPGWTAPYAGEGAAFLYLGAAGVPAAQPAWAVTGGQADAALGRCVGSAGDVNGDGYADILAGAYLFTAGEAGEGAVFVYTGAADGPAATPAWSATGGQVEARLGYALAGAGDVNADGYSDVLVSAYRYDAGQTDEGRVFAYTGSAAGLAAEPGWIMDGNQSEAFFGRSVAAAGDVDGDGYGDVIVGASGYSRGQTSEGAAFVFLGGSNGLSTRTFWVGEADQANALFGFSVAGAGDVNADGFADVLAGAYKYDAGEIDEGRAFLFLGAAGAMSTNPAWTFDGNQVSAYLGNSVAGAGDVNGDGYGDAVVGAYRYDGSATDAGRAFLFLGGTGGLASASAWVGNGASASAYFGWPVAGAGDVNGDGFADVLVGAWGSDANQGRAYVFQGSTGGLAAAAAWTAAGAAADDYFGASVAGAGDVNGDGFADVAVGGYGHDAGGQANAGRAQVFAGSAAGLGATALWTADGTQAGESLGRAVAGAGDVNGDGFADVLLGADAYDGAAVNEGRAVLFYGNQGTGLTVWPRAMRSDRERAIPLLGLSDDGRSFRLALVARTPFGRGRVALAWQAAPPGQVLGGAGTLSGTGALWQTVQPGGTAVEVQVRGLTPGVLYHWRCRLLYEPGQPWGQRAGRWLTGYGRAWQEGSVRTGVRAVPGDYDGDGAADQALYDWANGAWFIKSADGRLIAWNLAWGGPSMLPACGDYDGDGVWDLGVYQPATGAWYVRNVAGSLLVAGAVWGGPGLTGVPGDYDGDGRCDFGAYDAATGGWYLQSGAGPILAWNLPLGAPGFEPVPGDYDGDRALEPAVYYGAPGVWYARRADGAVVLWAEPWGSPDMAPVPGDYDGDGAWDLGVYQEDPGFWYVRASSDGRALLWAEPWGGPGLAPVPGDYDGDGLWDLAVYDAAGGLWFVRTVAGDVRLWADPWGGPGYTAVGASP